MRRALAILCCLALFGCATTFKSPGEVAEKTSASFNSFSGLNNVEGPHIDRGDFPNNTSFWLCGSFDKARTSQALYLVVWHMNQFGWKFLEIAADSDATPLPVNVMHRKLDAGSVDEMVAVGLTEEYLRSHAESGMTIRVGGSGGHLDVTVPGVYVQGFLARYLAARDDVPQSKSKVLAPVNPS